MNDLEALRDGSQEAFQTIYLQWRKPLFGLMLKLIGSRHDAEDITQEVFVRLWEIHDQVDPSRNIKGLIYLIARQLALKLIRKRRLHESYTVGFDFDEINYEDSSDIVVAKEMELLKQIVISRMSSQRQNIWKMSEDGLAAGEIAGKMKLSTQTVYNQLSYIRSELRELLSLLIIFFSIPE
jgi:RNA polymerase sigma-70 factor (ECF subfamily)